MPFKLANLPKPNDVILAAISQLDSIRDWQEEEANLRMRNRIVELALTEGMEAVADYAIKHNTNRTT